MDTDSFIVYIKAKDIYWNIVKDVKTRFDTSSYALDRPLPKVKDKKVIELIKVELGGKVIIGFLALRPKTYSFWTDKNHGNKKIKRQKKLCNKKKIKLKDYEHCLEATQLKNKIN